MGASPRMDATSAWLSALRGQSSRHRKSSTGTP